MYYVERVDAEGIDNLGYFSTLEDAVHFIKEEKKYLGADVDLIDFFIIKKEYYDEEGNPV